MITVSRAMTKVRGQNKGVKTLQPVGLLGEAMVKNGKELGDDSTFGEKHCFVFLSTSEFIIITIVKHVLHVYAHLHHHHSDRHLHHF